MKKAMSYLMTLAIAGTTVFAGAAPVMAEEGDGLYIAMISKGFQHQFWQTAKAGAEDAAAKYGATISFNGPPSESDIDKQVDMLKSEVAKKPDAVCLAALSTDAVMEQLQACVDEGIPVIGFDSGVPNGPEGAVYATASTSNGAAAALAADELCKLDGYTDALAAATTDEPIVVGILVQDATSDSITSRTKGYIEEMKKLAGEVAQGGVAVEGHELYNEDAENPSVIIKVQVAASADVVDVTNAAKALLNTENLLSVFCSNEGSVTGFLAATSDGSDLAEGGKYEGLIVAGFDAGATQKAAVRNGWFVGSITQDPYNIGYQAVELAVKACNGEEVSDVDTGAKWYTAENIDDPEIAQLVYD